MSIPKYQNLRGAGWMLCAGIGWATMTILVRLLSSDYSPFELLFFRNFVALIILLPVSLKGGISAIKTKRFPLHCLRAALACTAVLCLYYAIAIVPLPSVTALSFTQPLFVVTLAAILLKERVTNSRWSAVFAGFIGLLVIVRPGLINIDFGTFIVLFSTVCYATSNICVKRLMTTDTPRQAVIYFNLLMLPLSLVPAIIFWVTPGLQDLMMLIGIGICGTFAVYSYATAFTIADASAVMPFDFLRMPMISLAALILFGEVGDVWTWVGALIIFASTYVLARSDKEKN